MRPAIGLTGGLLSAALLLQAGVYYLAARRAERIPEAAPLAALPAGLGQWRMVREMPLEPGTREVLRADDTLSRVYLDDSGRQAQLFIAFFKTQRYGQAPHSPKNCMPGSGWEPKESGAVAIRVPDWEAPIHVNRYVIERGNDKNVVLYWYQSHRRVIPNEYRAKFWLVMDSIRYHRSDTSLVRVVVPVDGEQMDAATAMGVRFVQALFSPLVRQLPS
jgi:EpsI family protein